MSEYAIFCPDCQKKNDLVGMGLCKACGMALVGVAPTMVENENHSSDGTPPQAAMLSKPNQSAAVEQLSVEQTLQEDTSVKPVETAVQYRVLCRVCGRQYILKERVSVCPNPNCTEHIFDYDIQEIRESAAPSEAKKSEVNAKPQSNPAMQSAVPQTLSLQWRKKYEGIALEIAPEEAPMLIGRECAVSSFLSDDLTVSYPHFKVYLSADGVWMLKDLSSNGTFVDGKRVDFDVPRRLYHDAIIHMGKHSTSPELVVKFL